MLTENEVITFVADYLKKDGYTIKKIATTNQKGIDIIAIKNNRTLFIEAKGAKSSNENSSRYIKGFSKSQVFISISAAILKAMIDKNINTDIDVAIAFPDNKDYTNITKEILPSLEKLGIEFFFVSPNGNVRIE